MGFLANPQSVELRLEGGTIDDLGGRRSVFALVAHRCLP
jgi:hypothetical protein